MVALMRLTLIQTLLLALQVPMLVLMLDPALIQELRVQVMLMLTMVLMLVLVLALDPVLMEMLYWLKFLRLDQQPF